MLRRCASCGRVGNDLVRDDFLDGWVCEECPQRTPPAPLTTIAADIAVLTARVSDMETTASPTVATSLQAARGYLLRASMAVEAAERAEQDVSG